MEVVGRKFETFLAFDDMPENKKFDWGGLFKNVVAGLAVVGVVALTIASFGAAGVAVGTLVAGACIGGAMAVGITAVGDVIRGEVSSTDEYGFAGISGAITGAISGGINLLKLGKVARIGLEIAEGFITGAAESVASQMMLEGKKWNEINPLSVAFNSFINGGIAIAVPAVTKLGGKIFGKKVTKELAEESAEKLVKESAENITGKTAGKLSRDIGDDIAVRGSFNLDGDPIQNIQDLLPSDTAKAVKFSTDPRGYGGFFEAELPNGNKLYTSTGIISQSKFTDIVNKADSKVVVLSGTHGDANGDFLDIMIDRQGKPLTGDMLLKEDIIEWGHVENVQIQDVRDLNVEDLSKIFSNNDNSTIVCGWCFSERSKKVINAIKTILDLK